MTQLCEKALFQIHVTAGSRYQVRPDGEGRMDTNHTCAENTLVLGPSHKPNRLGTISAGTIIGPISEVLVVKILDECGVEVAIPSICKTWRRDLRCDTQ